ncbi:hypothetical protein J2X11_001736 [Aeromicrobium panaciterrae]|uniref:Uncharacterized protein n=1 Tax=Aeromicrobium panaciterrae TaxID=363861 RepID=A0ABU1UNY6_9ACTN|nr:GPGG-motif small membrane protein [Aeromicrobium panaciterrae]MDR7086897.1 hypothetical protein [Aeromicrobium panaciterrae]
MKAIDRVHTGYIRGVAEATSPMEVKTTMWDTILWIAAVVIGIFGVLRIVQRDFVYGAVLIIVALLVGPAGVSIFT